MNDDALATGPITELSAMARWSVPATEGSYASTGNARRADWLPPRYGRVSITESPETDEDEAWADLAAQALAQWARDNPF